MVKLTAEKTNGEMFETQPPMTIVGEYESTRYDIIEPHHTSSVLKIHLQKGQAIKAAPGSMVAMSDNMAIEGKMVKSFKAFLASGETRYQEYSANNGEDGWVTLAPPFLGTIRAVFVDGEVCIGETAFLAAVGDVTPAVKSQGLKQAIANQGVFLRTYKGKGVIFVCAVGTFLSFELGEEKSVLVDNDNLISWPADMKYERVKVSKHWISGKMSGESSVAKLSGPGLVNIQTRNSAGLASWIYNAKSPPSSSLPIPQ